MRFPDDLGAEDFAEQVELGVAGRMLIAGDVEDRAIVLAQPDRPVVADQRIGEITLLVLEEGERADPLDQGRFGPDPVVELAPDADAELESSRLEDLIDQRFAPDRCDRVQEPGGQAVVVRREERLGVGRDVVQVARPADPVTDALAADEMGLLERPKLLEDAGPTGPDRDGKLVRRRGSVAAKAFQDVAPEDARRDEHGRGRTRQRRAGGGVVGSRVHGPKASTGRLPLRWAEPALALRTAVRRSRCYPRPMDFDLSPEHSLLRSTVRDFMETEVAPVVDEHEKAHRFPSAVVRRLGEMGWLGIPVAEEDGGAGMDTLAYAIAVEEISRVWGSLGIIVAAHTSLGCGPLMISGTAEQKVRYLRPLASGAVIGAYGLTEPGAGSDAGGTKTTARLESTPDGGRWVIDGGKRFITNAGQAGTYIVTARTGEKPTGDAEISAFIVPSDAPGFSVGRFEDKMGLHASATGELIFDGCRIPAANLLGKQGDGFRTFLKVLDGGRISIAAMALGLAQGAYEAAAAYSKERQQFGRPIGTFQGVAFMIADMATEIEAARALVYRAAWLKDQHRDYTVAGAQAKLFASEVSSRVTNAAIQVHGGYGYIEEYKVERFLRDAKLTEIGEGTSQVQRLVIARKLLDLRVV